MNLLHVEHCLRTGSPDSSVGTFATPWPPESFTLFSLQCAMARSNVRFSAINGLSSNLACVHGSTPARASSSRNKCFRSYDCPLLTSMTQSSMTLPETGHRNASGASDSAGMGGGMTLGRAWGEGTCATGMGGLTALSASAQTGAQSEHRISGSAFQQSKWCRIKSPVTLHPGTRQLSPLQSATCLSWRDTFAQPGTLHTCAFAWPLAAGQDSAWRINLNKLRVFSMYKFSSLPRAISAATAIAN